MIEWPGAAHQSNFDHVPTLFLLDLRAHAVRVCLRVLLLVCAGEFIETVLLSDGMIPDVGAVLAST